MLISFISIRMDSPCLVIEICRRLVGEDDLRSG